MIYSGSLLVFLGISVYLWCDIVANSIFKLVGLISPDSFTLIKMNAEMAVKVFFVLAVALVCLAVVGSFVFSRKIAGPLFAFFRHLKKCEKKGKLEEFSLRKGDLFEELTENFNRVVRAVNAKDLAKDSETPKLRPFGVNNAKSTHPTQEVLKLSKRQLRR
jgi:hypothetical protein